MGDARFPRLSSSSIELPMQTLAACGTRLGRVVLHVPHGRLEEQLAQLLVGFIPLLEGRGAARQSLLPEDVNHRRAIHAHRTFAAENLLGACHRFHLGDCQRQQGP